MIPIATGDRKSLQADQQVAAGRAEQRNKARHLESLRYPGRRIGKPAGSHLDEIASLRQSIILCRECMPKFAPNPARPPRGYAYDRHLRVNGQCDGCRAEDHQGNLHLFVHESILGVSHKLTMDDRADDLQRQLALWEAKFPSVARQVRSA